MTVFTHPPHGANARKMTIPPHAARPAPPPRIASAAIAELSADPGAADGFWRRVVASGTPLIEGDGPLRSFTFLFRGEARRVALVTNKLVDDTTMDDALLQRVPGTDIWALTLQLGAGWRGSYALAVDDGTAPRMPAPQRSELELRRTRSLSVTSPERHPSINAWYDLLQHVRPDPLARERSPMLGSAAAGPAAPKPVPVPTDPAPGRVIPVVFGDRQAWWHVPAIDPGPSGWDVLVLLDGDRWLDRPQELGRPADRTERRATRLDAWAAAGILPPTATLLLGHGPLEQRVADLTCNPQLVDGIRVLIDSASAELGASVTADPARTTIAGQSLGGLTALYAQCLAPERFGASICQSGSFWWPNPRAGEPAEWLTRAISDSDTALDRVHLEVGTSEWVLLEPTRRLHAVLQERCRSLDYVEFDGGHDAACWEVSLPHALRRMTGGERQRR